MPLNFNGMDSFGEKNNKKQKTKQNTSYFLITLREKSKFAVLLNVHLTHTSIVVDFRSFQTGRF